MKPAHLAELLLLAALWGASFLFIRMGAHEFGPLALAGLRVAGASLLLLPVLLSRGEWPALRQHWRRIALVGLTNSAIPFVCYGVAALAITGGLSSIFNATTPLWGALIGWWWLGDRPTKHKALGLALGFGGVLWLAGGHASFKPGEHGVSPALAVAACLLATLMYGFSANFTKRHLQGIPSMALAAGSQLSAAAVLVPLALWAWPTTPPAASSWLAVAALAFACTGVAYILYFRLIAHVGASQAMSVTFLIPAFAVLWGTLFLGEAITPVMVAACGVILLGTALVTGLVTGFVRGSR
ncbi:EamA family transporter [Ideonella sp. 4Y16]|uniref:DMT family transporter n=1 Tax=Ideonella alba TaxID=2824118 RepID=UPI001B36FF19|nr:EamA family transporter [Ideonella alba]MBQ0943857.1 EamA family transporter [Ideonella alba]